ncbi:MAG: chemotaxis protein CheW [Gemmatimonadaceae bacterium]
MTPRSQIEESLTSNPAAGQEPFGFEGRSRSSLREMISSGSGETQVLVFRLGSELFAIDLDSVEEVIELPKIHALPVTSSRLAGVCAHRERLLPVYAAKTVLQAQDSANIEPVVLVIRRGAGRLGLAVDEALEVLTIVARTVEEVPSRDPTNDALVMGVHRDASRLVALVDITELVAHCVAREKP